MRRLFFWSGLLAAFLILRGAASSTAHPEREDGAEPRKHGLLSDDFYRKLTDRLKLSAEQQKKVKAVLDGSRPEMQKLEADMKALREKMQALARRTKESIRETLDLEQKERFDEMGAPRPGHHEERRVEIRKFRGEGERHEAPDGPGGPPPQEREDDD